VNFTLDRQGSTLARITGTEPDMPWFEGRFEPTAAFENVRPLFERWGALLDQPDLDVEGWEDISHQVRLLGIRLVPDDGSSIYDFALYVHGDRCRFRYG
jgi:hypothetical protein